MSKERPSKRMTSLERFAISFPADFPCDCRFCRKISINCSFAHQRLKRRTEEQLRRELERQQQARQQQNQEEGAEILTRLKLEQIQETTAKQRERKLESVDSGNVTLGITAKKGWKELLNEDREYRDAIEELDAKIGQGHETEIALRRSKNDKEFSKHLGLVKEYRKWSNEVYTPKTTEIYRKNDTEEKFGKEALIKGYDGFLKEDADVRKHGGYPHDRIYLDRWNARQYDPWSVAKASLNHTATFCGSSDPLGIQERHFLEEARGLHLLESGAKTGTPPVRAMKAWLRMPYSYYAWKNSGNWTSHWKGVEEKLPQVPSVCRSDGNLEAAGEARMNATGNGSKNEDGETNADVEGVCDRVLQNPRTGTK